MHHQRDSNPGDIRQTDNRQIDPPMEHRDHHSESENAYLGQLESHRPKNVKRDKVTRVASPHLSEMPRRELRLVPGGRGVSGKTPSQGPSSTRTFARRTA